MKFRQDPLNPYETLLELAEHRFDYPTEVISSVLYEYDDILETAAHTLAADDDRGFKHRPH